MPFRFKAKGPKPMLTLAHDCGPSVDFDGEQYLFLKSIRTSKGKRYCYRLLKRGSTTVLGRKRFRK